MVHVSPAAAWLDRCRLIPGAVFICSPALFLFVLCVAGFRDDAGSILDVSTDGELGEDRLSLLGWCIPQRWRWWWGFNPRQF